MGQEGKIRKRDEDCKSGEGGGVKTEKGVDGQARSRGAYGKTRSSDKDDNEKTVGKADEMAMTTQIDGQAEAMATTMQQVGQTEETETTTQKEGQAEATVTTPQKVGEA